MASAHVILVAEDNDDDFVLLRCAFESVRVPHKLIGVANGVEAINYLYADEPYTNRSAYPFPDLMLLDLSMPVMDDLKCWQRLKDGDNSGACRSWLCPRLTTQYSSSKRLTLERRIFTLSLSRWRNGLKWSENSRRAG